MLGIKAMYLLSFAVTYLRPEDSAYRHILLVYSIGEMIIEFSVYSMFFMDYMDNLEYEADLNAKSISMFASTYLIFCLPYKVFCIMILYHYSEFEIEKQWSDSDSEHLSKL